MKKKEYVHPKMHIYEISKMQLLAGSETLRIGNDGDEDVPTSSDGSRFGETNHSQDNAKYKT